MSNSEFTADDWITLIQNISNESHIPETQVDKNDIQGVFTYDEKEHLEGLLEFNY